MTIQSLQLMTIAILTASNRTFINMIKHYKCPKCEAALGIDSSTTKPVKCPKCNHLGALNEFQPLVLATHKCLNCNHSWKKFYSNDATASSGYVCPKCNCIHFGGENLKVIKCNCPSVTCTSKDKSFKIAIDISHAPEMLYCPHCNKQDKFLNFINETIPSNLENNGIFVLEMVHQEDNWWYDLNRVFELKDGINILGRYHKGSNASIQFKTEDLYMSKKHLSIFVSKNKRGNNIYVAKDISKNGTYINIRKHISKDGEYILEENDRIKMGGTTFLIKRKD